MFNTTYFTYIFDGWIYNNLKPLIAMFTTKLEINDKRVVGKMGLIKILTMDTPINKISSVKIEQGLMGQFLVMEYLYRNI